MTLRDKIIHEALKLFSLKGFGNTSIEDILSQTGSSKGGLYNYFKSKDDLFLAVLSEARKIWREKVLNGVNQTQSPLGKMRKLLQNYGNRYLKDSENIPGGCVFVTLLVELDDQRPDFAQEIGEGFSRAQAMMKRFLDQAQAMGELDPDVNTDAVIQVVFTGMLGTSVLYGKDKSEEVLEKSIAALLDYLDSLTASASGRKSCTVHSLS